MQHCGSTNCTKNGHQENLFAKLISQKGNFVDVKVLLQRHLCNDCGQRYTSRGPFYDGAMYGTPIVDVALALSMEHPAYPVEMTLANFGVQMSTDAILDYVRPFADRAKQLAPLIEGQGDGLYAINMLKLLFGVENAGQLKEKLPDVSVESLTDETYPRKKGAVKKIMDEILEGKKRVVHRGTKGDMVLRGYDTLEPQCHLMSLLKSGAEDLGLVPNLCFKTRSMEKTSWISSNRSTRSTGGSTYSSTRRSSTTRPRSSGST